MIADENPHELKTASGLVVKNTGRIEEVQTSLEVRTERDFYSWQVCRIVRRDWNLVCNKMFIAMRSKDLQRKSELLDLLDQLAMEAEIFRADVQVFDITQEMEIRGTVEMRIVSKEAHLLLRSLVSADRAMIRLYSAVIDGHTNKSDCEAKFNHWVGHYMDLKRFVLGQPKSTQSANEIAAALGVE